jgi:hypothetical protein
MLLPNEAEDKSGDGTERVAMSMERLCCQVCDKLFCGRRPGIGGSVMSFDETRNVKRKHGNGGGEGRKRREHPSAKQAAKE